MYESVFSQCEVDAVSARALSQDGAVAVIQSLEEGIVRQVIFLNVG